MAGKAPKEGSQKLTLGGLKIEDLVYSLEVKLLKSDKNWFIADGMISPLSEYNDPAEPFDFESVVKVIKIKIQKMTEEELENLKNNFRAGPLRDMKNFRDQQELILAKNYQSYSPEKLRQMKEKVEKIIAMQKNVEEILELVERSKAAIKEQEDIRAATSKKIKKITT